MVFMKKQNKKHVFYTIIVFFKFEIDTITTFKLNYTKFSILQVAPQFYLFL